MLSSHNSVTSATGGNERPCAVNESNVKLNDYSFFENQRDVSRDNATSERRTTELSMGLTKTSFTKETGQTVPSIIKQEKHTSAQNIFHFDHEHREWKSWCYEHANVH